MKKVFQRLVRFLKSDFVLLLLVACCYLFFLNVNSQNKLVNIVKDASFKLGLENLNSNLIKKLAAARIGLVTNQTGKDQRGERNVDVLLKVGVPIKKIFVPEHGFSGMLSPDAKISCHKDKKTGIEIVPLHSQGRALKISAQMVKDIDVLLFDMQDAGMRHYTYITTLYNAMESAAKCKKTFIVLDRPNMLGCCMNGPLVKDGFYSGISIVSVPLRHGMTFGELALFFNRYNFNKKVKLSVVRMKQYRRNSSVHNQLITYLSSGIRNTNACGCYSFLGVLGELRPLNIGLGTERKFECLLLNDKIGFSNNNWVKLQRIMKSHGVDSVPCHQKKKNNNYTGLQLRVENVNDLLSFNLLIKIISFLKKSGVNLTFSRMFDLALGTDKVKLFFDGKVKKEQLEKSINNDLVKFYQKAKPCFLYKPIPVIVPFRATV